MNFSPISIIPKQERSTTPDIFITNQYGKLPALHGDGPLTIHQAVRLSKLINGYAPAFATNNNRIISGFMITDSSIRLNTKTGSLEISISPGSGIIDKMIFKIPVTINTRWENFMYTIPSDLEKGKIILYFAYKDELLKNRNRPYPQDHPHYPTVKYPENQSDFNPISICRAFYDPESKNVVSSIWDPDENKIVIAGNIYYQKKSDGTVNVWVDEEDRNSIHIEEDGKDYEQQGGGYYDIKEIDGGKLLDVDAGSKIRGIHVLLDKMIIDPNELLVLESAPTSQLCVFYNGVYYYQDYDWVYKNDREIEFIDKSLILPGKNIYIYENLAESPFGYMNFVFSGEYPKSGTTIKNNLIDPSKKYLIFLNGLLQHENEYTVGNGSIKISYPNNSHISVYEIHEPTRTPSSVETIYSGDATDSSLLKIFGINTARQLLVFYNGVLYLEGVDYKVLPNTLVMNFPMSSKRKIKLIGI